VVYLPEGKLKAGAPLNKKRPSMDGLSVFQRATALFGRLLLGFDGGGFALIVFFAAVAFDGFVVLFSHRLFFILFARGSFGATTMNFYALRFNLYLLALAGLLLAGCQTDKNAKKLASLRVHLENRAQLTGTGKTVSVLRAQPVLVTINEEPILTEANVQFAELLQTPTGYAILIQFDPTGTLTLEQYTAAYEGKHLAVFSQWSDQTVDSRWLAAPLITHRLTSGQFSFTPDASLAECTNIVIGLNRMAQKIAAGRMKLSPN
jgi:hypothetical protein